MTCQDGDLPPMRDRILSALQSLAHERDSAERQCAEAERAANDVELTLMRQLREARADALREAADIAIWGGHNPPGKRFCMYCLIHVSIANTLRARATEASK
jgi:hypothetical protein